MGGIFAFLLMEWLFDFTSSMYQGGVVRAAFTLMSQDNVEDIFVATFVFATQYHLISFCLLQDIGEDQLPRLAE